MRLLCRFVIVLVTAAAVTTGCSGNGKPGRSLASPRLSVNDLHRAHKCPVDLAGAAQAAGLKAEGPASHSVDSVKMPADSTMGLGPVAGIEVDCSQKLGPAGSIDFTLFAVDRGSASNLGLPLIMAKEKMIASDATKTVTAAAKTPVGALVNLPTTVSGALGITAIKGKTAAIFMIFGIDHDQAHAIANNIGNQLY